MAATFNTIIPIGDLTLEERKALRMNAENNLIKAALDLKIRDREEALYVRQGHPTTDLAIGSVANTAQDWNIGVAGVAGTTMQWFAAALAINRCLTIYGLSIAQVPASVSLITLSQGPASAQIRFVGQLEELEARLEMVGLFSEGIIFIQQETIRAQLMPKVAWAANAYRLPLLTRVVEPIGLVISGPSV